MIALLAVGALGVLAVIGLLVAAVVMERPEGEREAGGTGAPARGAPRHPSRDPSRDPGAPDLAVPAPLGRLDDREVPLAMHSGSCRRNDVERRKLTYFTAMRGRGAAGTLRGKVAIIHLKMSTTTASWSARSSRSVTLTAAVSRDYLLAQAKRWKVPDLTIDAIEWPLATRFAMPPVRLDGRNKVAAGDGENLRKTTRLAVESAMGRSMQAVVDDLREDGYANVAFLVHFPSGPVGIRDFAAPTGAAGKAAEFAYLLEPDWNVTSRSALAVHELLHLFGADDLYEVRGIGQDEVNDIMNAQCDGLGPTTIAETTAFAVGWTAAPPRRAYGFSER